MAVMFGRYGRSSRLEAIQVYFDSLPCITEVEDWQIGYNAAPGAPHPIVPVKPDGGESSRRLGPERQEAPEHGPDSAKRLINAGAETVHNLPVFRQSLQRRRCLVPADWSLSVDRQRGRSQTGLGGGAWVEIDPAFVQALDGIAAGSEVILLT